MSRGDRKRRLSSAGDSQSRVSFDLSAWTPETWEAWSDVIAMLDELVFEPDPAAWDEEAVSRTLLAALQEAEIKNPPSEVIFFDSPKAAISQLLHDFPDRLEAPDRGHELRSAMQEQVAALPFSRAVRERLASKAFDEFPHLAPCEPALAALRGRRDLNWHQVASLSFIRADMQSAALLHFAADHLGLDVPLALTEATTRTGGFWMVADRMYVSRPPLLADMDADSDLHSTDAPVVRFRDGWEVWALENTSHGLYEDVLTAPTAAHLEEILNSRPPLVSDGVWLAASRHGRERLERMIAGEIEERFTVNASAAAGWSTLAS